MDQETVRGIILFDGVCGLCNASVNFAIDRDAAGGLRFAALQSEVGRGLLERHGLEAGGLESVVLIEGERVSVRSTAALRIARRLRFPWPAVYFLFIGVPRPLRDAVYGFVARNRYRWFGKEEACRVPTPELRERFLDDEA